MAISNVSDPLAESNRARRVAILKYAQIVFLILAVVFIYRAFSWGIPVRIWSLSFAIGLVVLSCIFLRRNAILASAHCLLGGISLAAIVSVMTSGGPTNTSVGWLLIIPPMAGLLASKRACLYWSAFVFSSLIVLVALHSLHAPLPNLTPEAFRQKQDISHVIGQLIALSVLANVYLGALTHYQDSLEQHFRSLQRESDLRGRAEEDAKRASLAKSRFMANMNHEIRTPLNSVLGFARVLKRQEHFDQERTRGALDAIVRNGEILLELVNELLDMSELEQDETRLRWQKVDVCQLLEAFCQQTQERLNGNTQVILSEMEQEALFVLADTQQILRAMSELVRYIDYQTDSSLALVSLLTPENEQGMSEQSASDQSDVVIRISVQECKVDIDKLQSLFDVDSHDVISGAGLAPCGGLGLALARRILRLHDGDLRVEQDEQGGIVFLLPLSASPKLATQCVEPTVQIPTSQPKASV